MALPDVLRRPLSIPVVASPMLICSGPELVIAQCKAGVVGSFPALNARSQPKLADWLTQMDEELAAHNAEDPDTPAAPFAVNQIVHRSNDRLEADLQACVDFKVPVVITSLGVREDINAAVHSYGGIVLHDVIKTDSRTRPSRRVLTA